MPSDFNHSNPNMFDIYIYFFLAESGRSQGVCRLLVNTVPTANMSHEKEKVGQMIASELNVHFF